MSEFKDGNIWSVYVHKNKVNGKCYVGVTSRDPQIRWNSGYGYKGQIFFRAINKYGWDNFEHIIIADHLTKDEASEYERFLIDKLEV